MDAALLPEGSFVSEAEIWRRLCELHGRARTRGAYSFRCSEADPSLTEVFRLTGTTTVPTDADTTGAPVHGPTAREITLTCPTVLILSEVVMPSEFCGAAVFEGRDRLACFEQGISYLGP